MKIDSASFDEYTTFDDNFRIFEKNDVIYAEKKDSFKSIIKNFLSKMNITQRFGDYRLNHMADRVITYSVDDEHHLDKIQQVFEHIKVLPRALPIAPELTEDAGVKIHRRIPKIESNRKPHKRSQNPSIRFQNSADATVKSIELVNVSESLIKNKDFFLKFKEQGTSNSEYYAAFACINRTIDILQKSEKPDHPDKETVKELFDYLKNFPQERLRTAESICYYLGLKLGGDFPTLDVFRRTAFGIEPIVGEVSLSLSPNLQMDARRTRRGSRYTSKTGMETSEIGELSTQGRFYVLAILRPQTRWGVG